MSIKLTDADHFEPCALCGNEKVTITQRGDNAFEIKCSHCGWGVFSVSGLYPAVQTWNKTSLKQRVKSDALHIHKERVMRALLDHLSDIQIDEIGAQIASDNLGNWCERWKESLKNDMRSVLNETPLVAPDSSNDWHYVNDSTYSIPITPVLVRCEWESEDGIKKSYIVVAELKDDGRWHMSVVDEPIHDKVVAWKSIS